MSVFVYMNASLWVFYVNMHVYSFVCILLLKDDFPHSGCKWNESGSIANLNYFSYEGTFNI